MFTGLVEEKGRIHSIYKQGETMVIQIEAKQVLEGVQLGDSISINGVCLTVTKFAGQTADFDVMPETFRNTALKNLNKGNVVNLERAMRADGRFGGHIVQGHVDGTGVIIARDSMQNAVVHKIKVHDFSLMKYMIPKGSITIDGISLTIFSLNLDEATFTVSIIPHTMAETNLSELTIGSEVNLECDVLGKYVAHLLRFSETYEDAQDQNKQNITMEYLSKHGFA